MTIKAIEGIHRFDDFLCESDSEYFNKEFFKNNWWNHGWLRGAVPLRNRNLDNAQYWGWQKSLGNDVPNLGVDFSLVEPHIKLLWDNVSDKLKQFANVNFTLDRIFGNCSYYGHSFGTIHRDACDITCLYYPVKDWDPLWEGGTYFYNDDEDDVTMYSSYKYNRLVLFDSHINHRPGDVTMDCPVLRHAIVFQVFVDPAELMFL